MARGPEAGYPTHGSATRDITGFSDISMKPNAFI